MAPRPPGSTSISLLGLRFDASGWRSRLAPWRSKSWGGVRELEISLQCRWRRFGYRFEFVDDTGRSLVLKVRGGLAAFRKLTRILELAQSGNSRLRVKVFSRDILEFGELADSDLLEAEDPPPYDLERRARVYLMALEFRKALHDAQALIHASPRHELAGRSLRLKALLLKGCMREARRELSRMTNSQGRIDAEAKAQYAIVALYRGRREGVRIARELIRDGQVDRVELVGLEFSRYLADRSRFKEALSVLRMAENRTRLVDPNLFKSLQAARGEVLSKKDYRFYRCIGFLFKARFRWSAFGLAYLLLMVYVIWPQADAFEVAKAENALMRELEANGQHGVLDTESLQVYSSAHGLTRLSYVFYRSGYDARNRHAPLSGESTMFSTEARRLMDGREEAYVLFVPYDASRNSLGPIAPSRATACWYHAFDDRGQAFGLALFGICLVGATLGRQMLV